MARFIVERRRDIVPVGAHPPHRQHLLMSNKSILPNHRAELARLLEPAYFHVLNLAESNNDDTKRRLLIKRAHDTLSKCKAPDGHEQELIVLCTYTMLKNDSRAHHSEDGMPVGDSLSLFGPDFLFDTAFFDEVAECRNPATATAGAVMRMSERCCITVGATATPIVGSILDIFNIGRVLGMPNVVERAEDGSFRRVRTLKDGAPGNIETRRLSTAIALGRQGRSPTQSRAKNTFSSGCAQMSMTFEL